MQLNYQLQRIRSTVLTPDDISCVTTSEKLDATVIELTNKCVSALKQKEAQFLKITSAQHNNQVAMVHCPNGEFSFDKGNIHDIKGKSLHCYITGYFYSRGSPILLWDLHAIGLHRGRDPENLGVIQIATHLTYVVIFHLVSRNSAIMYILIL